MKPFVNTAFSKAIEDYLASKDKPNSLLYNTFLVVVVRMLINIYGEADIINPYKTSNEEALDTNLKRFGAKDEEIINLKRLMDGYYQIEKKNDASIKREINPYFVEVQKCIIDLFNLKRINFEYSDEDIKEFFDLLYTPGTSDYLRISENFRNTEDPYEIAEYYKMAMQIKKKEKEHEEKDLLGFDVYKLFNVSIADLSKMESGDVDKLNKEIYESLDIKENAINKDYLLEEKIKEIKREKSLITTGNGYVDILLVMGIIVTTIMVISIFGIIVF